MGTTTEPATSPAARRLAFRRPKSPTARAQNTPNPTASTKAAATAPARVVREVAEAEPRHRIRVVHQQPVLRLGGPALDGEKAGDRNQEPEPAHEQAPLVVEGEAERLADLRGRVSAGPGARLIGHAERRWPRQLLVRRRRLGHDQYPAARASEGSVCGGLSVMGSPPFAR